MDSGHTWFNKEDFSKAAKDLEASRARIKELERGHEILNQALHESNEREDKLRDRVTKLNLRLTDLSDHVDVLAEADKIATDHYNCLLMYHQELKDELHRYKMGNVHDLIRKAAR